MRLGVSETVVQSWLPDFVAALNAQYPLVDVEITVDVSLDLRDALLNRALDLAILMGPISEFSINNVELPAFELVWIRSPDLTVNGGERDILRNTPVISYARNTRPYRDLRAKLQDRYGTDARLFPSSSLSALHQDGRFGARRRRLFLSSSCASRSSAAISCGSIPGGNRTGWTSPHPSSASRRASWRRNAALIARDVALESMK